MGITHTYVSSVPDDGNPNKVGSSEWNAAHTIAAGSIVTADIADANVTLQKLAADSVDAGKVVDGSLTKANLSISGALDGVDTVEGTAAYANGMIPIIYSLNIPDAGTLQTVTITNKIHIVDFLAIKKTNEASGASQVNVYNGANIVGILTFPDSWNAEGCYAERFIMYPAYQDVADGGVLGASAPSAVSNKACEVFIIGYRVA